MNAGIYITVWLLVFGCRLLVFGWRYWLPAKATDNQRPITDNLQPIIYWYFIPQQSDHKFCLEDSTLPVYAHRIFYMFWYCLPDSCLSASYIPRLRPGLLSLRSVLSSRQILLFSCFVVWLFSCQVLSSRQILLCFIKKISMNKNR